MIFTERNHLVKVLDPIADAFSGTPTMEVINMENWGHCSFIIYQGVGATGSSTITVLAASNVTPDASSAIPFHYREYTTGDTGGALTAATTSGYINTVGSSRLVVSLG